MGWKYICFGSNRPSFLRVAAVSMFMLGLGLSLYAFIARFIPSDAWSSIGFYLSVGLATQATLWVYWGHLTGRLERRPQQMWLRVSSYIALPFVSFGYFYLCLVYALPDRGTYLFGARFVRTEAVTTHFTKDRGRRTIGGLLNRTFCRYYIKGPGLDDALLFRICSASYMPGESDSPSSLDLAGKRSWFGFHVSEITLHPAEEEVHVSSRVDIEPSDSPRASARGVGLPSAIAEHSGTIKIETIDANSYRLILIGAVFDSAEAGQRLLSPKAGELCGGQVYRFGESRYAYSIVGGQKASVPAVKLTQDVHCGETESAAAKAHRAWLEQLPRDAVLASSEKYFEWREAGRYEEAYGFFDTSHNGVPLFDEWRDRVREFHAMAGDLVYRRASRIKWYGTVPDDIYVALDFAARYANTIAYCAHQVWRRQPDQSFLLVREEEAYKHREQEGLLEDTCAEGESAAPLPEDGATSDNHAIRTLPEFSAVRSSGAAARRLRSPSTWSKVRFRIG